MGYTFKAVEDEIHFYNSSDTSNITYFQPGGVFIRSSSDDIVDISYWGTFLDRYSYEEFDFPSATDAPELKELMYAQIKIAKDNENSGSGTSGSNINSDPGGRTRVSQVLSLGDYRLSSGFNEDIWVEASVGAGAGAWTSFSQPYNNMAVTGGTDKYIMQSRQWHPYFTGKPQFIEFTCIGFNYEADVSKRFGYFSSNETTPYGSDLDGIIIVSEDSTYKLQVWRSGTQTASISNADWDDPLDGSGPSGLTIDWSGFNVFAIDFLWLGGTAVRLIVNIGGTWVLAHTYSHAGLGIPNVMISSPAQPVRFEIESTGGSGSFDFVCSNVSSEGPPTPAGVGRESKVDINIDANAIADKYAICGIRLDSTNSKGVGVFLESLKVLATTNDDFIWEVHINPTLNGTPTWSNVGNSLTEQGQGDTTGNPSTTTVSADGIIIQAGPEQGKSTAASPINNVRRIGWDLDGNAEEIWLIARPLTINLDIYGSLNYIEVG